MTQSDTTGNGLFQLRASGVAIVVDARSAGMPTIVHWGADLGSLSGQELRGVADVAIPAVPPSSIDLPLRPSILPVRADGWTGRPGVDGSSDAGTATPSFRDAVVEQTDERTLSITAVDQRLGLRISSTLSLTARGLLRITQTLTNNGSAPWTLATLAATLPVPAESVEVLDFGGRWAGERQPQRRRVDHGAWVRRTRHGRPGHDAPILLAAGAPGFGFRHGEVWAVHLAWGGDHDLSAEASATGHRTLAAGELLAPGEVVLRPGESYAAPEVFAAWSDRGLDGVSEKFHDYVRTLGHSDQPPPVVLNTWEAVYFEQNFDRLAALAERAASVGVERFVLDDGWMNRRTDDTRALGDWTVDPVRWPQGLHPLVDRVRELGMQFGLWIEPEMVSLDSDLAREHPEWLLTDEDAATPIPWRHQHILDLANPDAFAHIRTQLTALLDEYPISYLKWDQNRDIFAGSPRAQTLATLRLMAELRERYPDVVIESCSSGGGRVDLGTLRYAGRIWASDTNDPVDRTAIQRWTSLLVPPELIGSHIGAPVAHTTKRHTSLALRIATATLASAGIEWDLGAASEHDLAEIRTWIEWYKGFRSIIPTGTTVRPDAAEASVNTIGIVSADGASAVFETVCSETVRAAVPPPMRLAGLDESARYRVELVPFATSSAFIGDAPPPWMHDALELPGSALTRLGLALPPMNVGDVVTVQLQRVAGS